jgi:hypothetical protein
MKKGLHHSLETRQRMSESIKRAFANPKIRQRMSEAMTQAWADPKVRQYRSEAQRQPDVRERKSHSMKRRLNDPEVRQRWSEAGKRTWADPEIRQRRNDGRKRALSQPEVRLRLSEGLKACWTPERRAAMRIRAAKIWKDREAALKQARWRPADWWKKPALWRLVALILLSRDGSVSNQEVGKALDATKLIPCPRSYGGTWRVALSESKVAKERIREIRRWIGKPGNRGTGKPPKQGARMLEKPIN